MKKYESKISYSIILLCLLYVLYYIDNNPSNAVWIGVLSLIFSAFTVVAVRRNTCLTILFSVIFYINLSSWVLGPLTQGVLFAPYQQFLWVSEYDTIGMKCLLVSSVIFFIVLSPIKKMECRESTLVHESILLKYNLINSIVCLFVVIYACLYAFTGSTQDGYVSNSNPIFEYAIFFLVLSWYYSGKNMFIKSVWCLCCCLYLASAFIGGDRSSAFMLLLVIVLYKYKNINLKSILLFCFLGISTANYIAAYRDGMQFSSFTLEFANIGLKTLFSDTAAQSYYTGITIYSYIDKFDLGIAHFLKWCLTLFTGSYFVNREDIELSYLANEYDYNGGGGLFPPYFFLLYRYWGVAIGTLIVGKLLIKIFYCWKSDYAKLLMFVIPATAFRWYLYTPTTLFRSCLINFGIIYCVLYIYDKFIENTKNK